MPPTPAQFAVIGTGFVADLYMRSLDLHPGARVLGAHDRDPQAQSRFCAYWSVPGFAGIDALLAALPPGTVILNLTNPASHYGVTKACLQAGFPVYSEKPLAMTFPHARELVSLAQARGLALGGAPCSYLSQAAQTLGAAVRGGVAGPIRLIYAELDDGYIPQAPHETWLSESGAPWPYADEMQVGCTLEHAGYVLTWLIAIFGSIETVTAVSACTIDKGLTPVCTTPDTSVGIVRFEAGPLLRLTCSIVAPHDHRMRLTGDTGVLELRDTWDNFAPILFRKRMRIRRRLLENPLPRRLRLRGPGQPSKARRRGAAQMDFALGPMEMAQALSTGRMTRAGADIALHCTEATLALQNAGTGHSYRMQTRCDPLPPMDWAGDLR